MHFAKKARILAGEDWAWAAADSHSYLVRDAAAVFFFKSSQPVLQYSIVVKHRLVLRSGLVSVLPF